MNEVKVALRCGKVAFVRRLKPDTGNGPVGPFVFEGWWFTPRDWVDPLSEIAPTTGRSGYEFWTCRGSWREGGQLHPLDITGPEIFLDPSLNPNVR